MIGQKNKESLIVYLLLILWPLYLLFLPYVYSWNNYFGLLFIIFPGLYMFPFLGLLIHETWHRYFDNVPNRLFYVIFCLMLISDPQVYDLVHTSHHADVNTFQDMQFHPLGNIKKRFWRIVYNFVEIFLGVVFVMTIAGIRLPRNPKYKTKYSFGKFIAYLFGRITFIVGMGILCHLVWGVSTYEILIPYLICYWMGSVLIHHGMLIEHGNLIVEGTLKQRNIKTRNMIPNGIIERIILFFTHNDPLEHLLHHSMPQINTRPLPRTVPMPDNSVYITFKQYLMILRDMLMGKGYASN